jgi:transcriptional regulator with XRE-family HTH domain
VGADGHCEGSLATLASVAVDVATLAKVMAEGPVERTGDARRRDYPPIGERLRAARQERGLSLRGFADRLGVSPSLISQIENGRARPSVNTLYAMTGELGVSIDDLLFVETDRPTADGQDAGEGGHGDLAIHPERAASSSGPVQRSTERRVIRLASGVIWERLTTAHEAEIEFLKVTYEVGGASSPVSEFQRHGGHEWGYVISGSLGVTIGFEDYELGPGDSVSLDSTTPHRLYNRGTEPVRAIWFVLGRRSIELDPEQMLARRSRLDDGSK